ncbi:MAG: hypothetical protein NC548_48800 [Lachnospiraceae bacterium]|nr:hypothetical protein [Lachnospiraceae bacterium]
MKQLTLRLDDVSVKRLDALKKHKDSEFYKFSQNDLIRLAIRCLYEDEGLDWGDYEPEDYLPS